jgi:hypothetical protein
MASALSTFNDFVDTTGPSFLTSAEDVVNEACRNNYLLRRFLRGKGPDETVQGGTKIKDTLMFDESNSFQFYQPNDTFTWSNPQVLENWEIDWRFAVDHMAWTDQEIELNVGGGMGKSARHQTFKKLKRTKEQRLWTSILNGMEDVLFAVPSPTTMEGGGEAATNPYSIPAFVNECTSGAYQNDAAGLGTGFLTVQNINSSTEAKWRPQQVRYTNATAAGSGDICQGMDEMFMGVQFTPPPSHQEYFETPSLNAQFIACSQKGQQTYVAQLRAQQDTFVTGSRQDPAYMRPQYAGIDLERVVALDTYAGYAGPAGDDTPATEGAVDGFKGPRYYFINGNYMKSVFHSSRYMYSHPTMRHPNQPFTTIMPVDSWYNFICRSRQRQGILSPTGNLFVY